MTRPSVLRFRAAPLRQAAILAVGFVVVRLVYRFAFHGLDGGGAMLLELPVLRLPDPFGHVTLLGPVTSGGIWNAVASALPIAAVILAFGVLNACVDASKLFARAARRGPLRGTARALVIAWSTVPALADAVRHVSLARRLRGERGAASLLVPLFERTVERAVAIAAAMEVRGFAAAHPVDGACATPVEVRGAVIEHGDGPDASAAAATPWRLEVPSFVLAPGTLTLVGGPTGSGKSTLLHTLTGLHSHFDGGRLSGTVRVGGVDRASAAPRETAGFVGVVLQDPRLGFAAESPADEIGFALAARGVAGVIVADRVAEVSARIGIGQLLGRDISALSAGEATLVAIAAAIVDRPSVLVIDEPLADLDADARARIVALLDELAHRAGVCVVVAEHRLDELAAVADRRFAVDGCRVVERPVGGPGSGAGAPAADAVGAGIADARPAAPAAAAPGGLHVRNLVVEHAGTRVVEDADLDVAAGELVALVGPNGAGKSSLLQAVALPRRGDRVAVGAAQVGGLAARARRSAVALVPEASDDLLCATTVAAECRRADRTVRAETGSTLGRFLGFVGADATAARLLAARHPRDLSTGERRCLAIAIQLAADASVLLIDEPTRGLDDRACGLVAEALRAVAAGGTAVVFATHDDDFAERLAARRVGMRAGRLDAATAGAAGRADAGGATEEAAR